MNTLSIDARALAQAACAVLCLAAAPEFGLAADRCSDPGYRQFDFWLGEWQVRKPDGSIAGVNRIVRKHGGCVIQERYVTGRGYSGESLNTYDPARRVWHQTWVDSSGLLLLLEGRLVEKSMVLEGQTTGADGKIAKHRITWTPNPDGSVRQLWESAGPEGPWGVTFDGLYKNQ